MSSTVLSENDGRVAEQKVDATPALGLQMCDIFIRLSLGANIVILVAVCTVLIAFGSSEPVIMSWGPPTPSRGILLSIYFAILVLSVVLLGLSLALQKRSSTETSTSRDRHAIEHMVAALLAAQVLYKITTPATAGTANPIAISNLGVSALHSVTLYLLWQRHNADARVEDDMSVTATDEKTIKVDTISKKVPTD